jgi:ABC-type lipoprotein export system ATPase subunit
MIATKDVRFSYPNLEFNFPNIACNPSETLLITGKSGTGKTTFLHILSGILKPHSGSVKIGETFVENLSDNKLDKFRGENIGLVLQQSHFIASLSILENLILTSWLSDHTKKTEKAKTLLKELGLENQMHKKASQLSIGQQQRASIARALINQPKVLLADEPTSSLDDENAQIVADLLSKLSKQYQASLIIVTHDQRLKNIFTNVVEL